MLKFFPAEAAGGAAYLKSLAGPLPQVSFCPTGGGVSPANAAAYLALPNVICAGGSWIAPAAMQTAGGLGRDRGARAGCFNAGLNGTACIRPSLAERISAFRRTPAQHRSVIGKWEPKPPTSRVETLLIRGAAAVAPVSHRANERTTQNESEQDRTPQGMHRRRRGHAQPWRASRGGRRRSPKPAETAPVEVMPEPAPIASADPGPAFYAGAQIEYGDVDVSGPLNSDGTGGLAGVFAGYRYDFGNYVIGGEIDLNAADIDLPGVGTLRHGRPHRPRGRLRCRPHAVLRHRGRGPRAG